MSSVRSLGPHAFESCLPFASLDLGVMGRVVADAQASAKLRSRVCCHRGLSDSPQEMVICLQPLTYIRPHRHLGRAESGLGLRGVADAVFFTEDGGLRDVWPMGAYESGLRFFYRIQEPVFHCLLVRAEPFVFHEVSTGPFTRESTEFAPWSPPEEDSAAVSRFVEELRERVEVFYREHRHE